MPRFLKIILWVLLSLLILVFAGGGIFIYKVKYGFPVFYETEAPDITVSQDRYAVLLFSKTTGFRHGESIDAGQKIFQELADKNGWYLYRTEEGGIFNPSQLSGFDAVIFNNSTGRVLNDDQRKALESYVENGGVLIGIHGAGDDSHHWEWYKSNLLGSEFSHHSLNPQLQEATVVLQDTTSTGLIPEWNQTDEWYVFYENPKENGFKILYTIDGESISASGNILWMTDKDFGMGKSHPVAWHGTVGQGRTFYTSMGHNAAVWQNPGYVKMLELAVIRNF